MDFFEEYVRELELHAVAALAGNDYLLESIDLTKLLTCGIGLELRRRVSLEHRQRIGAFFTGATLRQRTFAPILNSGIEGTVWDPACGAGDLLLSYAEKLPTLPDIGKTVASWGSKLHGNDTESVFLRAAKARLVIAAYARGSRKLDVEELSLQTAFPYLCHENSLLSSREIAPSEVCLNPPFIPIAASADCEWGNGGVSAAAVFVDMCLRKTRAGTRIVAILPDVLRTGTRYERWRRFVREFADIKQIDIYGPFDPQADVDVFILEIRRRAERLTSLEQNDPWIIGQPTSQEKIGSHYSVSVGPVVPHRHKEEGPELAYLHARDAPPWAMLQNIAPRRRFNGTTHHPPFVVIRRTSSPSDKFRAIGTIIDCAEAVAVENHLIICKPHDKTIETCQRLIEVLKNDSTSEWLNNRIRCRHLTITAVKEIPISITPPNPVK